MHYIESSQTAQPSQTHLTLNLELERSMFLCAVSASRLKMFCGRHLF